MKGWAGSLLTGGTRPGTGSKPGPPPFTPTHPTWFDEKSGGAVFCCAEAGALAATTSEAKAPPAKNLALNLSADIVLLLSRFLCPFDQGSPFAHGP
jgi:hypothetical protein